MVEKLNDLRVYRSAILLSDMAWSIYRSLPKEFRYEIGSQFLSAVDSIGANIAEGFGRYHYRDKIKFYYNARGSLWEVKHWSYLLHKRGFVETDLFKEFIEKVEKTGRQLNHFIKRTGKSDG